LPVPYNKDTYSLTFDTWDNVSLGFRIIESRKEQLEIEVTIRRQEGYWYYGSLDNAIPLSVVTKKKLTVSFEGTNQPVARLLLSTVSMGGLG